MTSFFYITILLTVLQIQDTAFGKYCYRTQLRYVRTYKSCGFLGWGRCSVSRQVYDTHRYCCPGWKGSSCNEGICTTKCENYGICTGPNHCECRHGYTGSFCQIPVCREDCRNGGTCVAPNHCKCRPNFKGNSCQIPICSTTCQNGGTCIRPGVCQCSPLYTGSHCQEPVCSPKCKKGSCSGPNRCTCEKGWSGNRCDTPLCEGSCKNGGICILPNRCECPKGYIGTSCQNAVCNPPCQNSGTCVRPNVCKCPAGVSTGEYCQNYVCSPECINGGFCNRWKKCDCPHGYTGRRCETPICSGGCKNRGTCVEPDVCKCTEGYSGSRCEMPICDPECQNGGTCIRPGVCQCPEGVTGNSCQSFICSPVCENGGLCSGPFHCECTWGYEGNSCETPVCTQGCVNGGRCTRPDHCDCPSVFTGDSCEIKLCSHLSPCYPGLCEYPNNCSCSDGFTDTKKGCLTFSDNHTLPVITGCEIILAHIRRTDKKEMFYFSVPCSDKRDIDTIWCNQERFNHLVFKMNTTYSSIIDLPSPPAYISETNFGIVENTMHVQHTKYPRHGNRNNRLVAWDMPYSCAGVSDTLPKEKTECNATEENYKISIEHDDIFTVKYSARNGGYRKLFDKTNNTDYKTDVYNGTSVVKEIEFRFDFIAPTHCSETIAETKCVNGEKPIHFGEDIRKEPLTIRWDGWSDTLSGIASYYLEIFKLEPNIHGELTELKPLKPIFKLRREQTRSINFPTYYPPETGMYSVLLQASDKANNSKIARRLFLYDNDSSISLTKSGFLSDKHMDVSKTAVGDGGMHVISAIPETGYMWQTSEPNTKTHIVLNWENHFVNRIYETDKLLNTVLKYPTQFADLQDSGILRSKKYVNITDEEGTRTRRAIPNKHGIVKFEINRVFSEDLQVPVDGWMPHGLQEQYETRELLADGSHIRLWVRATDIMNHTRADYTEVHIDNTPPRVANEKLQKNIVNGSYTHTSRITFIASDDGSGVHRISFKLFVGDSPEEKGRGTIPANRDNKTDACATNPSCNCVLNTCFLVPQTLDIDNCLFLVPKDDLNSSARIQVEVYNQAVLHQDFNLNISRLTDLHGLEEYSGPTNIRVEKNIATGVRLAWDLPETASCYGRADMEVILLNADGSKRVAKVHREGTFVDLVGLEPEKDYDISLKLGYKGTQLAALPYAFKTAPRENYLAAGAIVGIVTSVLLIIGLVIAVFVVLLRRGHMQPIRKGIRAMSVKYHSSVAHLRTRSRSHDSGKGNTDSLYMYGEIDFNDIQKWQLQRDDVILESLLKSGNFADIYIATVRSSNRTVVAKALKEDYRENDLLLMKAKINFSSIEVGQHENVLRFIGAVVEENDMGPFIIYEYCPNGQMSDYLQTMKNNITLETYEHQLQFGRGIAKGMKYLAEKKIVHRRLAARNILLDADLVPKISGFGPQPDKKKNVDGQHKKRERIPLKWMAPECLKSTAGATEKSDVWSFGVVLWEIFSFGDSPYENIRGRELPSRLKGGYRLPKPDQCEDKWYGVMKHAWAEDPKNRPTFKEIVSTLDEIFVSAPVDNYYYKC